MCWHLDVALFGNVIFIHFFVPNYWLQEQLFLPFQPTYPFISFFFCCVFFSPSFDLLASLNSNPLALSTAMHIQKADWNYLRAEASCASLLSRHCEGVSLPGVSLALFHTLSFLQVYGPLSIIRKVVEMLFESLLGSCCVSATVRGFTS